jgi:ferredoxin
MACPTCFCSSFADATALTTDGSGAVETVRLQHWSSCFQLDHSNLAGRPVRNTTASRYRQWLTHKLQTWPEQFGTAGCVGCGRCTTWCPAAIDIVAEATALIDSTPLATARPS